MSYYKPGHNYNIKFIILSLFSYFLYIMLPSKNPLNGIKSP